MSPLIRALSAESLKLRGTLALWMCLIAPATVVALYVLQVGFSDFAARKAPSPEAAWMALAQSTMVLWAFLMLPLLVTLQSALLAGLEHGERQWKHLLALPVPRRVHYLAKTLVLAAMVGAAFMFLVLLIPVGGWLLMLLKPEFGLAGPPPWQWLLRISAAAFAASMLIVAVQTWIAIRWSSFTVAVAIGMSATVAGYLIGQSARFGHWYPWSMPLHVMGGKGEHLQFVVIAGLAGGLLATLLGLADYLRREVS